MFEILLQTDVIEVDKHRYATKNGHLECLNTPTKSCPWDLINEDIMMIRMKILVLMPSGHLECLKYLHNGCPWDERTCSGLP